MTQSTPQSTGLLMGLIVTLLAPTFLGVTAGDLTFARMAAIETINDYRARNNADLMAIAQIIACGLAALGSLSLSMDDDISLSMTLRLRGNAVALNRSAEQNRRVLNQPLRDNDHPATEPDWTPQDNALLSAAAEQELAEEAEARLRIPEPTTTQPAPITLISEKQHQEMWAVAMINEASEITASIPNLPAAERQEATMRATALSNAAHELLMPSAVTQTQTNQT
jgi:hypothetical protein